MTSSAHKNEFDALVQKVQRISIQPFTPGQKAGILWAEGEIRRLREVLFIDREDVGRIMHESWTRTKREQGFHHPDEMPSEGWYDSTYNGTVLRPHRCGKCHDGLILWEQLPEGQKDINRHAFDAVLAELRRRAGGA